MSRPARRNPPPLAGVLIAMPIALALWAIIALAWCAW